MMELQNNMLAWTVCGKQNLLKITLNVYVTLNVW